MLSELMTTGALGQGQGVTPAEMAEAEKIRAETSKVQAEAELVAEKIISERVVQQVQAQGVELDWETLRMNKAKAASDIMAAAESTKLSKAGLVGDMEIKRAQVAVKEAPEPGTGKEKRGQGPYRERGMASNNKKVE
jgi:hypothetical protein